IGPSCLRDAFLPSEESREHRASSKVRTTENSRSRRISLPDSLLFALGFPPCALCFLPRALCSGTDGPREWPPLYEAHFSLSPRPFGDSTRPESYVALPGHDAALRRLRY